jgi:hypothetical protein
VNAFIEPLEGRRLMSAGALCSSMTSILGQAPAATALNRRAAAATAQISLFGAWSGTYDTTNFGSGTIDVVIKRQKGSTVKGTLKIDGFSFSGSVKLATTDVDAGAFNLSYKRGRISATLTGQLSADSVNGSFTFKYGWFGPYNGTFQLQRTG